MALTSKFLVKLIAKIKGITNPLLVTVYHSQWLAVDGYGKSTYAAAVAYKAALSLKSRRVTSAGGQEIIAQGTLIFLEPVVVSQKDRITLPDGSTPAIATFNSPASADGTALVTEVVFGQATAGR